jgi:hypothetical protein
MDAIPHGELGALGGPMDGTADRADDGRQATSGDGLPRLSRSDPTREAVHAGANGSGRGTGGAHRRVPVPQREVDSEDVTGRCCCRCLGRAASAAGIARQHPRCRVPEENTCYSNQ